MKNRFILTLCCVALPSCIALPSFAQVARPGPRFTPEQLREMKERDAEQRTLAEAEYQKDLEIATEKGKQIKLTIRLDSTVVSIPADIQAQIEAYEAGQRRFEKWNRAWRKLAVLELEARKKKQEQDTEKRLDKPLTTYGNLSNQLGYGMYHGRVVSKEDAIKKLGPPPVVPAMPERPIEPLMVLELKNISDMPQRIYPASAHGKPRHHVEKKVLGEGIKSQIHNTSFGYGSILYDDNYPSVDLAPGETYHIPLNRPGTKFPLYFTKPGIYHLKLVYTSGIKSRMLYAYIGEELEEDAMVIHAEPAKLNVVTKSK